MKVTHHLLETNVTKETPGRTSPKFWHSTDKGWEKLCRSDWLKEILSKSLIEEAQIEREDVDLDYELHDVL